MRGQSFVAVCGEESRLASVIPPEALLLAQEDQQKAPPAVAKDPNLITVIEAGIRRLRTEHRVFLDDSRSMDEVEDESVHLAVTSPPYWTLKEYPGSQGQLGAIQEYESFLDELDRVWRHVLRVLVPGGRLVSS
jgi:hypothetical protein